MSRFYSSYDYDIERSNNRAEEEEKKENYALAMSRPSYEKWDIVMVELGQICDCCLIRGYRPAIVYSETVYNERSPIMQIIPLTRQFKGVDRDYHVFLDKNDCIGYESSGVALVEQIRPVDRIYVKRKVGEVDDFRAIDKINTAVAEFFGFDTD